MTEQDSRDSGCVFSKWCDIISPILIVCVNIKTIFHHGKYSGILNSAPFYLWILVNALYFLPSAFLIFITGVIKKRKKWPE